MRTVKERNNPLTLAELRRLGVDEGLIFEFRLWFGERAAPLAAVVKMLHYTVPDHRSTATYPQLKLTDYTRVRWESSLLSKDLNLTSALISEGADVLAYASYALTIAASEGSLPLVELLISRGAGVNDGGGCTIRYAAAQGHFDVVRCLVEHGANITATQAIECARKNEHKEIAAYLQGVEDGRNRADARRIRALKVG